MKILVAVLRIGVLLAGLVYGFLRVNPFAEDAETLHVALVADFHGARARTSETMRKGLELFFGELNAARGVGGRTVVLDVFDDRGSSYRARRQALLVVQEDRAVGVIGHTGTSTSESGGEIYEKYGIPAITPMPVGASVTRDNDWYFRSVLSEEDEARFLALYVASVLEEEVVAIVTGGDERGKRIGGIFRDTVTRGGVDVRATFDLDPEVGAEDLRLETGRIVAQLSKAQGALALFLATDLATGVELVRGIRDAGLETTLLAPGRFSREEFPQAFRDLPRERVEPGFYTDDLVVTTPFILDAASAKARDFYAAYRSTYGEAPPGEVFFAYDAALLLLEGVKDVDRRVPNATVRDYHRELRDYLESLTDVETSVRGLTGLNYFDDRGDSKKPVSVGVYRNNKVVSAFQQLREARLLGRGEVRKALETGRVVRLDDKYMYKTDIIFAGVEPLELSELDLDQLTFRSDFYLWFRYRRGNDGTAIEFLNAAEEVELGDPVDERRDDKTVYRLYRVDGRFKMDYLQPRVFGQHVLGIGFRHRDLSRENVVYVVDTSEAEVGQESPALARIREQQVLSPELAWSIERAAVFEDIVRTNALGNPDYSSVEGEGVEFSSFNAVYEIEKSRYTLLGLLSVEAASYILFGGLILVALYSGRLRARLAARSPRWLWVLEAVGVCVLLLATELVVENALLQRGEALHLGFFDKAFDAVWWAVAAVLVNVAVGRFVWAPLEAATGRKIPGLVRHFTAVLIATLAFFGVVAFVMGQKITGLLATSGVVAMIIGLAVQMNISNIFSGIALNLEQPFRVGDRVSFGESSSGKVIDVTWRSTRLLTPEGSVVSVPNSVAAEGLIRNFDYPDPIFKISLEVKVGLESPPPEVERALRDAALSVAGVLSEPPPVVFSTLESDGFRYDLVFGIDDYGKLAARQSAVSKAVWSHLKRKGIAFSAPSETQAESPEAGVAEPPGSVARWLEQIPLFASFSPQAKSRLEERMMLRRFARGEVILQEGTRGDSLFLIFEGVVSVRRANRAGAEEEIRRLGPGDCFGEGALLTGDARTASVVALSDVEVYEIGKADIEPLLSENEEVATGLAEMLLGWQASDRERALAEPELAEERRVALRRVRTFFGLRR